MKCTVQEAKSPVKSRPYIYDVKFLALLGAPYIYDISRLRVITCFVLLSKLLGSEILIRIPIQVKVIGDVFRYVIY
jgi:hypothetical protein